MKNICNAILALIFFSNIAKAQTYPNPIAVADCNLSGTIDIYSLPNAPGSYYVNPTYTVYAQCTYLLNPTNQPLNNSAQFRILQFINNNTSTTVVPSSNYTVNSYGTNPYFTISGLSPGMYIVQYQYPSKYTSTSCPNGIELRTACCFSGYVGTYTNNWSTLNTVIIGQATSANFDINGQTGSPSTPLEEYVTTCSQNPFILNNTSTVNLNNTQYELFYQQCNSTGGGLTGSVYGYSTWQDATNFVANEGLSSNQVDMKSFAGGLLGSNSSIGNYYLITLRIQNACSSTYSEKKVLVHMNGTPTLPSGNIQLSSAGGACTGQDINNPCVMCGSGLSFAFANPSGTITEIDRTIIDFTGTSPFFGTVVYSSVANYTSGLNITNGLYPMINTLTSFVPQAGKSYWFLLTLKNACGSQGYSAYFTRSGGCKTDMTGLEQTQSAIINDIVVYPNPISELVKINLSASTDQRVSFIVYDLTGRQIMILKDAANVNTGLNQFEFKLSSLQSGTYTIQAIFQDGSRVSQKIIKE